MNTKMIPSAFTLANLLLGVVSLVNSMDKQFAMAALMILLSMVLDGMDGKIARRFDATSSFGKELDSLADLVSFGVAPAILIYAFKTTGFGLVGLLLTLLFVLCGAIRLARFNVLNITDYFVGVPITAAGSFLALIAIMDILLKKNIPPMAFAVVVVILAFLMVSRIKVPKY